MLDWTMLGQFYSFFVLLILFVRYYLYERNVAQTERRLMLVRCLLLSMGFIALNVVCVVCLAHPDVVPRGINLVLNTLYLFVSISLCSLYAFLLFDAMLEHVYDKHCLRRAKVMLITVTGLATALTIINLFTGLVFFIDHRGFYHRGPLNRVYYLFLIVELVFLLICFVRNRGSVSDRMLYVIRSMPPIILLVCVLQIIYPDVLLNGTICAVASMVIFLAFRSSTEEHDGLTGANSRKAFMSELVLRADSSQSVHMIQIALLNIADINVRFDHTVGDALLYEVSKFLRHCNTGAQVFRTSGTTFTVLLPLEDDEQAEENLRQIQERMQATWTIGEVDYALNAAIAEVRSRNLTGTPSEIVERIEYTMSLAKENPPLARFDEATQGRLEQRMRLVQLMRRSIDERKFKVQYQPLYCCHHDYFCSAEALLRLSDENGEPVSPDVFIPLAEENGMITELTWIVLEDICTLFQSGSMPGLESVSINLSMKQLMEPALPAQIRAYLDQHQVSPEHLKVEITERFLLHDAQYAKTRMEELQALGIQVYMDDFGTGYSNLSNVLQFPFSFIKLDRSLITPIAENKQALTMVSALTKLFQDMDKRVVAEGVELEEQVECLRDIGIDMIQGFYYAKPMPADQLPPYFSH